MWRGPPPCHLEYAVWTGLLSTGSLHPVQRLEVLMNNHRQNHLRRRQEEFYTLLDVPSPAFFMLLTWFSLHVDGLCLGELERSNPSLALHFWVSLQVVGLRPSVGNNEIARVFNSNIGCGQVDSASASVAHLCLGPGHKQKQRAV